MNLVLLHGDGIGPEVVTAAERVIGHLLPEARLNPCPIGYAAYQACGSALPDETLHAVRAADATLLGAVTTPVGIPNYSSPILRLRQELGLFANLRPVISTPLAHSRPGVDMMIVRENSEGLYVGRETLSADGSEARGERLVTRAASERIMRRACELARERRGRVTVVHKANVLRETCGLFLRTARSVAAEFPGVQVDDMLVDACAMRLLRAPEAFDVIVTTNLFGDILSDEASELVGGLGVACSANIGADCAVFEPVHGSAPDIAGTGAANPLATLGAVALLFDYVGRPALASRLRDAIAESIRSGSSTPDLGGTLSTDEVIDKLLGLLLVNSQ